MSSNSSDTLPSASADTAAEAMELQSPAIQNLRASTQAFLSTVVLYTDDNPRETYHENMRRNMLALRAAYNALSPEERRREEVQMFDALFGYFLDQEKKEGPGSFTLKDLHNAVVRDFANPDFHQALMRHFMSKQDSVPGGDDDALESRNLAVKAKEFDANGIRRRGFNLVERGQRDEGMAMVAQARAVFGEVLHYWEVVRDEVSQARVLYELGHIAEQTGDFQSAAEVQNKSAVLAMASGDFVGGAIASIKECEAQFKGKLKPLTELIKSLEIYAEVMQRFATEGKTTAAQWIGNAHAHLAEVLEAAGQIDRAITAWNVVLNDAEVQKAESLRQLKDRAPLEIARLSDAGSR